MKIILLFIVTLCAVANHSFAEQFSYKSNHKIPDIEKILFSNGDELKIEKDKKTLMQQTIAMTKNNQTLYGLNHVKDGNVVIKAAYPNAKNAKVAIVEANCGGSMCATNDVYIAYLYGDKLNINFVGNAYSSDFQINMEITNSGGVKVNAINVPLYAWDKYGDMVKGIKELINGKGVISSDFKKNYLKIVNEHPEVFFSSENLREPLARKIGFDNFREIRSYMSGPSDSKIYKNGRMIILDGCMAHSCPNYKATVLVDASTDKFWVIWADIAKTTIKYGTTDKWSKEIAEILLGESSINYKGEVLYENERFTLRGKR